MTTDPRGAGGWTPPGPAMLFCPADRPDRFAKAAARADVVILDLEDAVAPDAREAARRALVELPLDPTRTVVRINAAGTEDRARDLHALAQTEYQVVMTAKSESADELADVAQQVIALIETPLGAVRATDIAMADNCAGLMWGAEDLVAAMGGRSSRFAATERDSGTYRDVARCVRSTVRLAAAAFGRFAVDAVHIDIDDVSGLAAEATDAVALGYAATACIHPAQVEVIRRCYRPTEAEYIRAREIVDAAHSRGGVFRLGETMVDGPVITQAHSIIARHAATTAATDTAGE
ncbi:citrate (pro-3S)-lyase subunit beta [Gordonia jinhuaensis]|uniref:Citrate lyase subunit beta-like protein n=2 Tax=Gordonia jinhuaensis TaxID=1517702 RepID=A0A916T389_9ACTN|nr:citrate lyase subunit beta-like protein [Gordonia jinhuaensis]